ncbi:hypothetical protein SAMN04488054_12047 [Salibacterium qingdaonense]|uniref:PemK-like, MazF-like toxin of type II toxin-antitoxin system n=1 Tax=Salibacterium qingdaonense TaxID=266892 RepID=A0A1I4NTZ7_9BACI|nr:hypothetical protein SAMN04488054_12047 [Salibacterium qingdaonense]
MSGRMKQGDVWLADVLFKGTDQTKQRPVIIVGNELALAWISSSRFLYRGRSQPCQKDSDKDKNKSM